MAFYSKWDNGERATAVVLCIAAVSWFGLVSWLDPLGNMFDQLDKVAELDEEINKDYEVYSKDWPAGKTPLTLEEFGEEWISIKV
jgi:hypothetical protein